MPTRRAGTWAVVLLALIVWACRGGPDIPPAPSPPGSTAGLPPAKPVDTFLDARVAVCPTAEELAAVSDVRVELTGIAATRPLVCSASSGSADMTYHLRRVRQALILMKELRFTEPLPWTGGRTLWEWFRGLGVGLRVVMDDTNANCCLADRMIHFTVGSSLAEPVFGGLDSFGTITAMIHEARHIEVGAHPCQGRYDNLISDLGAFGAQNIFQQFLARKSDPAQVPAEYAPYLLWRACANRGGAFCLEPARPCDVDSGLR
jgi:hypothetical protein